MGFESVSDEVSKRLGVKFITRDLALRGPEMAVGIKDSGAKELVKNGSVATALDVIGEVGAEKMVDVGGIGGTDTV